MVFFTCNACGSSLKKNQVEKHYQSECPCCEVLSCMDCGRDFHGDEYVGHTKCISEAEKYQGGLYRESGKTGGGGKGERKQQEWLERVKGLAVKGTKVNPRTSRLLERIAQYPNIPRKRAKFENFVKNSVNVRDPKTLGELWDIFSTAIKPANSECGSGPIAAKEKNQNEDETEMAVTVNGESSQQQKKEKKKKKNVEESMVVEPCNPPDIDSDHQSEAKIRKRAKKSAADDEMCDIDPEPSKKKTKKRKRKHREEVEPAEASNAEEEDNSTAQCVEEIEVSYETKKKRKRKHSAMTEADESILTGDMEHTKKKKKKRSKAPTDTSERIEVEDSVRVGPMEVAVEYINCHHSTGTIADDGSKTKLKITKKKRKIETFAGDGEGIAGDMPAPKKQRKHKHKSDS